MVYLFSTFIYIYLDSWRAFGKEKHVTFNVTLFEQLVFNACITIKVLNNMIGQMEYWNEAIHYVSPCPCFCPILSFKFHWIQLKIKVIQIDVQVIEILFMTMVWKGKFYKDTFKNTLLHFSLGRLLFVYFVKHMN
jgi:hypothetical protein